jgi:hypothetical protein
MQIYNIPNNIKFLRWPSVNIFYRRIIRYRDADGYDTVLTRLPGEGGQISKRSNLPSVLPQQTLPKISGAL